MCVKKLFIRIIGTFIVLLGASISFSAKPWAPTILSYAQAGFFNDDLEAFEDVLLLVSKNYVYPPDFTKVFSSAIRNMAEALDPSDVSIQFPTPDRIQIQEGKTNLTFL